MVSSCMSTEQLYSAYNYFQLFIKTILQNLKWELEVEFLDLWYNKFNEILKGKGLQVLEVKQGDSFDAELHDAITQIPAPDKKLKGKIIDVIEKGFTLGDKIIRHPKVVVGN